LFACSFLLMSACISLDDDVELVNDLVLSVESNGHVVTEELNYEFEILDGNGGYKATVSKNRFDEDEAKVTIDGTKVTVDLLEQFVSITITDQKGETASLNIRTSHESLTRVGYGVSLEEGDSCVMDNISFGAGRYSATLWEGNSAEVTVTPDDRVWIKSLKSGNSYYKLTDWRGTSVLLEVYSCASYTLTSVDSERDQVTHIALKYGEGGWKLLTNAYDERFIDLLAVHTMGNVKENCDSLQINAAKNAVAGKTDIVLMDKAGNVAVIHLWIRQGM
jgi:hypothetical protein